MELKNNEDKFERQTITLEEWHAICRQQDAERLSAKAESDALLREQAAGNGLGIILLFTLYVGLPATFILGIAWLPGLPSGLLTYTYQAVPAEITAFSPEPCGKYRDDVTRYGIQYKYEYNGEIYQSSRVLPFPFSNDYLPDCGNSFYKELNSSSRDPKTNHILTKAYVNSFIPSASVLRRGIPLSPTGFLGLFSLCCALCLLWLIFFGSNKSK